MWETVTKLAGVSSRSIISTKLLRGCAYGSVIPLKRNLIQILTTDAPWLARKNEILGIYCQFTIWFVYCFNHSQHHSVPYQLQLECLFKRLFRLITKKCQRFPLLAMYGESYNTRLCMVTIFDTVLNGANTSATIMLLIGILSAEHVRHITVSALRTRQYQGKENDYMHYARNT